MTDRYEILPEIVDALAEVEGITPQELDYTLYDSIDTDAVKTLLTSEQTEWEVTFYVPDHTVTVRGDGELHIDGDLAKQLDQQAIEEEA